MIQLVPKGLFLEYDDGSGDPRRWFRPTGLFAVPRPGEFYLSGASPEVYRCRGRNATAYWIMEPIDAKPYEVRRAPVSA